MSVENFPWMFWVRWRTGRAGESIVELMVSAVSPDGQVVVVLKPVLDKPAVSPERFDPSINFGFSRDISGRSSPFPV